MVTKMNEDRRLHAPCPFYVVLAFSTENGEKHPAAAENRQRCSNSYACILRARTHAQHAPGE